MSSLKRSILICSFLFLELLISSLAFSQSLKTFYTPEKALLALEDAYRNQDIEAAIAATDFPAAAQLSFKGLNEMASKDSEIFKQMVDILELSFRKDIADNGYPNFTGAICEVSDKKMRSDETAALYESCKFANGATSEQVLLAHRKEDGWRIIGLEQQ